jgi:hypothetical protein
VVATVAPLGLVSSEELAVSHPIGMHGSRTPEEQLVPLLTTWGAA